MSRESTNYLLSLGESNISNQRDAFDKIDTKVIWLFAIISSVNIFLLNEYFLPDNFDILKTESFILLLCIIFGFFILGFILQRIISGKNFNIGPVIDKQLKNFDDKKDDDTKKFRYTLNGFSKAVEFNREVISDKGKNFQLVMYMIYVYILLLATFIILTKISGL